MEEINGITFEDYGAAMGNITQGMSEDQVCEILGIEKPVWQETSELWAKKMGDLFTQDLKYTAIWGEYMKNPKVGKFANVEVEGGVSIDEVLKKIPDYDTYQKISYHQEIAYKYGINVTPILEKEYGLTLIDWGAANMHYTTWRNSYADPNASDYKERNKELKKIEKSWKKHWKEHYKENATNLGEDIDF